MPYPVVNSDLDDGSWLTEPDGAARAVHGIHQVSVALARDVVRCGPTATAALAAKNGKRTCQLRTAAELASRFHLPQHGVTKRDFVLGLPRTRCSSSVRWHPVQPRLLHQPDRPDDRAVAAITSCAAQEGLVRPEELGALAAIWLFEKIVGTTFEISGLENIPEGRFILAPKHQSLWDTYAPSSPGCDDPFYILKRELTWIPLFGWYILEAAHDAGRSRRRAAR